MPKWGGRVSVGSGQKAEPYSRGKVQPCQQRVRHVPSEPQHRCGPHDPVDSLSRLDLINARNPAGQQIVAGEPHTYDHPSSNVPQTCPPRNEQGDTLAPLIRRVHFFSFAI